MATTSNNDGDTTPPRTIVIGAGVSGLACARELRQRRHNVLVLEARNRVGGRLKGEALRSSTTDTSTEIDLGGALIHGIDENPIYDLCRHMGIETRPVSSTLLFDEDGLQIDPAQDQTVSELFNKVLDESFAVEGTKNDNFGTIFDEVAEPHLNKMSPEDRALFSWHQQNLEVSCGASFHKLGHDWNEDEPYGYDGEHVSLHQATWSTVMEKLKSGLTIQENAQVVRIENVALNDKSRRKVEETPQQNGSTTQSVRRSSRANKGVAAKAFTISETSNEYYEAIAKQQEPRTVVHVTLSDGTTLQADSVVCTLPLGVLKLDAAHGGVDFVPPLPLSKKESIKKLGCGLFNKCALLFSHAFWQNDDFLGVVSSERFHLMVNHNRPQPVLVFWFGGDFAKEVQEWTNDEIVEDCLRVLHQATGQVPPTPLDYAVTRWGMEPHSRGAFVYMPPGADAQDLVECSEPILCPFTRRPVLLFAGEHTTPYHPSTIHGAYSSGIREAYRLDVAIAPLLNDNMTFNFDAMYKRTFSVRTKKKKLAPAATARTASHTVAVKRKERPSQTTEMTLRKRPRSNTPKRSSGAVKENVTSIAVPVRKSHRSTAGKRLFEQESPLKNGTTDAELEKRQADMTLLRAVESYGTSPESWRLIHSKVLPDMTIGQLRARHQQLLKEQPPKRSSRPKWDPLWVVSPTSTQEKAVRKKPAKSGEKNLRKSKRRVAPRLFLDM